MYYFPSDATLYPEHLKSYREECARWEKVQQGIPQGKNPFETLSIPSLLAKSDEQLSSFNLAELSTALSTYRSEKVLASLSDRLQRAQSSDAAEKYASLALSYCRTWRIAKDLRSSHLVERAIESLYNIHDEGDFYFRLLLISKLGSHPLPQTRYGFEAIALYAMSEKPEIAQLALSILGQSGSAAACPYLKQAIDCPDILRSWWACLAATNLGVHGSSLVSSVLEAASRGSFDQNQVCKWVQQLQGITVWA